MEGGTGIDGIDGIGIGIEGTGIEGNPYGGIGGIGGTGSVGSDGAGIGIDGGVTVGIVNPKLGGGGIGGIGGKGIAGNEGAGIGIDGIGRMGKLHMRSRDLVVSRQDR